MGERQLGAGGGRGPVFLGAKALPSCGITQRRIGGLGKRAREIVRVQVVQKNVVLSYTLFTFHEDMT